MKIFRLMGLPLLVFTAIVVQRSGVGQATIYGIHPDIVMLMVASIGVYRGREIGALSGFFSGLVVDAFLTTPFGISALIYVVVGYLAGELERIGSTAPLTLKILTVGVVSIIGEAFSVVILFLLGLSDPLKARTIEEVVIVGGVNLLLAPLALMLCRLVFGPDDRQTILERR